MLFIDDGDRMRSPGPVRRSVVRLLVELPHHPGLADQLPITDRVIGRSRAGDEAMAVKQGTGFKISFLRPT